MRLTIASIFGVLVLKRRYCGQNINKFSWETKYKLTIFYPHKVCFIQCRVQHTKFWYHGPWFIALKISFRMCHINGSIILLFIVGRHHSCSSLYLVSRTAKIWMHACKYVYMYSYSILVIALSNGTLLIHSRTFLLLL